MAMVIRVITFIILISLTIPAWGVDLTKFNLNYQINPYSGVEVAIDARRDDDSTYLIYQIALGPQQKFDNLELGYLTQPSIETKNHRDISAMVVTRQVAQIFRGQLKEVAISNNLVDSLVILEVYDKRVGVSYFFDTTVLSEYNFPLPKLTLKSSGGKPIIRSYALTTDTLKIHGNLENAYAYYYGYNFPPASPPMSKEKFQRVGKFQIDSVLVLNPNEPIRPEQPGLYFFQSDSSSLTGRAHLVLNPSFPRYGKLESLIECTRYITTADEFKDLQRNPTKAKFDALWLDLAGDAAKARGLIRRYYSRIEEANTFFTSYKEGWKTDQGIIYTIFGTPDKLVKGKNFQQWYYDQDEFRANVTFTFVKVKDLFSREHYELLRSEKYAGIWFRSIEKWRTGR